MERLNGSDVVFISTLGSMYDNDCVMVKDDKGNHYRMPARTIAQMVNEFVFKTEKKRKHTWLEVDFEATDKMQEEA